MVNHASAKPCPLNDRQRHSAPRARRRHGHHVRPASRRFCHQGRRLGNLGSHANAARRNRATALCNGGSHAQRFNGSFISTKFRPRPQPSSAANDQRRRHHHLSNTTGPRRGSGHHPRHGQQGQYHQQPKACHVRGTKWSRNPDSSSTKAGLPRSKRVLLGRSDSASSRLALEGCSCFCVLERSCSSNYFEA